MDSQLNHPVSPPTREHLSRRCRGASDRAALAILGLAGGVMLAFVLASAAMPAWWGPLLLAAGSAVLLGGVAGGGDPSRRVVASHQKDAEGKPKFFMLSLGQERITLEPGRTWTATDYFKWVTRGLIEEPQSYHVAPDGTVHINGEIVRLPDADGLERLEQEVNKRRAVSAAKPATPGSGRPAAAPTPRPDKVQFKVKLDHLAHLLVECCRGADRVETGLRGLPSLVQNGLMIRPKTIHVDPLQRYLEIDGTRFECDEAGAHQLQDTLNSRYAPSLRDAGESAIEIRENPAAATGFEIHFWTVVAGARFEVKGHLSQSNLDILTDPAKCELIQPGIILRLSPPSLLFRRKRPDGGEERIPELPDVPYRKTTATQLQQLFNHPLVRRGAGSSAAAAPPTATLAPGEIVEIRIKPNPQNKQLLWLELVLAQGGEPQGRAFTHHNLAELQHAGLFQANLDVALSLDNRRLSILNLDSRAETAVDIGPRSDPDTLARVSQLLTSALRPVSARPAAPISQPAPAGSPPPTLEPALATPSPPSPPAPSPGPEPTGGPTPALAPTPEPAPTPPPPATATLVPPAADPSAPPSPAPEPEGPAPTPDAPSPAPVPEVTSESDTMLIPAGDTAPTLSGSPSPPPTEALFQETDPFRINPAIFRRVADFFRLPVQDLLLSIERVFHDRRFEIVSFTEEEVGSVFELRDAHFYGFYLSHIREDRIDLVYACRGLHLEWGNDKCVLQPSLTAEPAEYKGHALRGLAQDRDRHFVFIVEPAYKTWVHPHEKACAEALAHFVTPREFLSAPQHFALLWPRLAAPAA